MTMRASQRRRRKRGKSQGHETSFTFFGFPTDLRLFACPAQPDCLDEKRQAMDDLHDFQNKRAYYQGKQNTTINFNNMVGARVAWPFLSQIFFIFFRDYTYLLSPFFFHIAHTRLIWIFPTFTPISILTSHPLITFYLDRRDRAGSRESVWKKRPNRVACTNSTNSPFLLHKKTTYKLKLLCGYFDRTYLKWF